MKVSDLFASLSQYDANAEIVFGVQNTKAPTDIHSMEYQYAESQSDIDDVQAPEKVYILFSSDDVS